MSMEQDKPAAEEAAKPPSETTPDLSARETVDGVQQALLDLKRARGHWPIATVSVAQITLRTRGAVYTESERNTAGEWRTVISPGNAIGAMPGSDGVLGAPLTEIASDWHLNSEEAFAQALRRYCDLSVGPEVKK